MLDIDTKTDIKYRASILKNVLGGLFTIGALQLLVTIFAHKSQSISLVSISFLIPILAFAYWHVTKYKKVAFIGRCLIYFSMPVLIYRAHTMGGAWGVTINWIYLAPIMSSLFLPRKEIYFVTLYCLSLVFWVGIEHVADPAYALERLLLVPPMARVFYTAMPLLVICYIIDSYARRRVLYLKEIEGHKLRQLQTDHLAALGEMAAGIAHEINNPLTILSAGVSLLKKKLKNPENSDIETLDKQLARLDEGVLRITSIVESVKAVSRKDQFLSKCKFNLDDLILDIIDKKNEAFLHSNIKIDYTSAGCSVYASEVQAGQIISNLINNAFDEISVSKDAFIKIRVTDIKKFTLVRVVDSGDGIPLETQNSMFNPFYTSKEVGKGTGLGLSISKRMAQYNDGDIYYELFEGNTSFVLLLPKEQS